LKLPCLLPFHFSFSDLLTPFRISPLFTSFNAPYLVDIFLIDLVTSKVRDIEDLRVAGKKATACPYFAARNLAEDAEMVFCPYK
jgi:hypothetical protein